MPNAFPLHTGQPIHPGHHEPWFVAGKSSSYRISFMQLDLAPRDQLYFAYTLFDVFFI